MGVVDEREDVIAKVLRGDPAELAALDDERCSMVIRGEPCGIRRAEHEERMGWHHRFQR